MQHIFKLDNAEIIYIESPAYADLTIVQCGHQKQPLEVHPRVWKNTIVHYVYKGHGVYIMNGKKHPVHAGQAFVIFPNDIVTYETYEDDPWEYKWIEFGGAAEALFKKAKITRNRPIIDDTEEGDIGHALEVLVDEASGGSAVYKCMAAMWELIHAIVLASGGYDIEETQQECYVRSAKNLIRNSYQTKLSVEQIAHEIGLERTYLNKLFQRYENMSIQQYMTHCRMKNAVELLKNPRLSIKVVGENVGYEDQFTFSKAFKRFYKVSPAAWQKEEFGKAIYKK